MAQERLFHQMLNDTTYTKIFVGGLAWETEMDTMRRYFEQFGEIHEAVVITDKHTCKSKGYGFVTFKDPNAAVRACQNPSPFIDGRKANCNLAILGATKPYPNFPPPPPPHPPHGYSQSGIFPPPPPVSCYGGYCSQQYVPYYSSGVPSASGLPNMYPNFYLYHGSHIARYGAQYPYWQQSYNPSAGILPLPSNLQPSLVPELTLSAITRVSTPVASSTNSGVTIASPEQNS